MGYVNKWLTPYQRSFSAIKEKLLQGISSIRDPNNPSRPLITDLSEGNILVLIISLFSAIAEVIHYYIDNMAREAFFTSCRRYDSLIKHANFVDYYPCGATASRVNVYLIASELVTGNTTITKNTQFTDKNGNVWLPDIKDDLKWDMSKSKLITIPLVQHIEYTINNAGQVPENVNGKPVKIIISNPSDGFIEQGSINEITISGVGKPYTRVETFAYSKSDDTHFRTYVDTTTNNTVILFGDGRFGKIPPAGETIGTIRCYITKGVQGNIPSDSITAVPNELGLNNVTVTCTNPYNAAGGSNGETFADIKNHVPQSVRTMGVAITVNDFKDLAELQPEVDQAVVEYECGRKVNVFIKPLNGVVASSGLCDRVYQNIIQKCPVTTWLSVNPVSEIRLHMSMEVTGKKGYKSSDILTNVKSALTSKAYLMHIGDSIRISDIYALIDNLPMVDYLHIQDFYATPQVKIIYGNVPLVISDFKLNRIKGQKRILVQFTNNDTFMMYSYYNSNQSRVSSVSGTTGDILNYSDNEVSFDIRFDSKYSYDSRYRYIFDIAEPNMDMVNTSHDVPVIDVESSDISISVNEIL